MFGRCGVNLSALVEQYGYALVFVGALAEGESVLLAAGFAAHRGLLQMPLLLAVAALGATLGDQVAYFVGRRHGPRLIARFPSVARHAQHLEPLVARHPALAVISMRFTYGLRTAGAAAIGALGIPRATFALFNAVGALLWAGIFCGIGWQFGNAMQWALGDLRAIEEALLVGVLVAGLGYTGWRWWHVRRRR